MKKILSAFTIVELLVVISIIGILVAAGAFSYSAILKGSRDGKRKADLEQIRAALELYRSDNGQYITYTGGCAGLPAALTTNYLPVIPPDPGTASYYCVISSSTYTLSSTLENATTSCAGSCGSTCRYSVGPYGKTCGP